MNVNNNFTSIRQIQETYLKSRDSASKAKRGEPKAFEEILNDAASACVDCPNQKAGLNSENLNSLKFSKHADERLADRNIYLTEDQLNRLEQGTRKADEKGIRESLVIMDNLSFIVNVKNRTVITAMDHTDSEDNIYTNIDGAVII